MVCSFLAVIILNVLANGATISVFIIRDPIVSPPRVMYILGGAIKYVRSNHDIMIIRLWVRSKFQVRRHRCTPSRRCIPSYRAASIFRIIQRRQVPIFGVVQSKGGIDNPLIAE